MIVLIYTLKYLQSYDIETRNSADEVPTCALCMDEIESTLNYKAVQYRNFKRQYERSFRIMKLISKTFALK